VAGDYEQKVLMAVKKATTNDITQLWWGYNLQLNMATQMTSPKALK